MEKEVAITKNKKILVKPIDKDRPFFKKGHDGRIRYTGCTVGYTLPWKNSTRSYVNIFEDGEQALFEKALNLAPGTLNLYNRKKSWWSKFFVYLDKNEVEFDRSQPMKELEMRVLEANKDKFCKTMSEYNGTQDYILVDKDVTDEINYKNVEKTEAALAFFNKIKTSNKNMFDALRVMGLKPGLEMKANSNALKGELLKVIEQKTKVGELPSIDDFIAVSTDKLYSDKIFVLDAIEIDAIELRGETFKIKDSGLPLGRSLQEVAEYFHLAKNQEDKLLIQRKIELNK